MGISISAKSLTLALLLSGGIFSSQAFAGWGAIAYSPSSGEVGYSDGYDTYADAVSSAISECGNSDCYMINYEQNLCNAFATGPNGTWGEAHGYADTDSAVNSAVGACGADCAWQVWVCN